jgi:oxygen-independent coproporphyrinogen-3 oxidase
MPMRDDALTDFEGFGAYLRSRGLVPDDGTSTEPYNPEKHLVDESGISGLYIHLPFCASRCAYCDFVTDAYPADDPLMRDYTYALAYLIRTASVSGLTGGLSTFYLGGGTPSYTGSRNLSSLVYLISTRINLTDDSEFTMELNPDSFDEKMFRDLWALGINRYSVGVQSFDDGVLATLGRRHDARRALEVIELLGTREANCSIDLICGIPGQSRESFLADVRRVIDLGIPHVSIYPLTIEEGTPLQGSIARGEFDAPDEDLQADLMLAARDMLEEAGIMRYEVSNYARPGFEAHHNLGYWTGRQYLGVGTAASSFVSAGLFSQLIESRIVEIGEMPVIPEGSFLRLTGTADARAQANLTTMPVSVEVLDRSQVICEAVMLRMRLRDGISEELFAQAMEDVPALGRHMDMLVEQELVEARAGRFVPTDRGWLCGNTVFGSLWDAAEND